MIDFKLFGRFGIGQMDMDGWMDRQMVVVELLLLLKIAPKLDITLF